MKHCPSCGHAGRAVSETTIMSLLGPAALERRKERQHRFCPTPRCPVVYFGAYETLGRHDLRAPVFCKEPVGNRVVCYCLDIREQEISAVARSGERSPISHRVCTLVRERQCACALRNPHGSCCLNEIVQIEQRKTPAEPEIGAALPVPG